MKSTDLRKLFRVDLQLTALALGCSQIGGLYRATSAREVEEVFASAWAAGVRYFDTAPFYGYTRSEHRLGTQLAEVPRAEYVVSTKVGRLMRPDASVAPGDGGWANPYPFRPQYDYSYSGVMRSFEDSQQRLGLAHIDILYVHDIGRDTHGDLHTHYWQQLTQGGGFKALDELRSAGMVKAVGLGVNEWQVVMDSMREFDLDCTMLAGRYTLLEQTCLNPFLDECVRRGNAIVIAGPFNSGILAGNAKFNYAEAPTAVVTKVRALESVCSEWGVPLQAAALQFPMAHPAVVSCVTGTRTAAQLLMNVEWFEYAIPAELWRFLRERGLLDPAAPVPM
ncbi:aldo/keto reductase [Rhodoferax sp. GW822-FHT02A01]|uniref:aldo/keto reductase n=1 Tax=Rhodoferax sp. GW822-FHT02A01 TaxID=3141537 RepID=UPI00315C702C